MIVLLGPVADMLGNHDVQGVPRAIRGIQLRLAVDAVRGRILQLGGGMLALGALIYTARTFTLASRQNELNRRTFELGEQGQVTDRYARAIEQLGSRSEDVRIGGIYALERIASDSDRDRGTITEVLAAFVRRRSRSDETTHDRQDAEVSPSSDVMAAITVIMRRNEDAGQGKIDLRGVRLSRTRLTGAPLDTADLTNAILREADLTGAQLASATLTGADLTGANLHSANLSYARLEGAILSDVNLTEATLTGACLSNASINKARLNKVQGSRCDLSDASLQEAELTDAQLPYVNLDRANLTGATLSGAMLDDARCRRAIFTRANMLSASLMRSDLSHATLTSASLSQAQLTEASFVEANLFEASFDGADLSGVDLMTLSSAGLNLEGAKVDLNATLPDGWTRGDNGCLSRSSFDT